MKIPVSRVSPAGPWLVARTLALCIIIGFAAGWLILFVNMIPFIGFLICFFLGLVTGRALTNVLDSRLEHKVGTIVVFGLLIGMSLSPFGTLPLVMIETLQESVTHGGTIFSGITSIVSGLFSPVAFIAGVLRPILWGDRW